MTTRTRVTVTVTLDVEHVESDERVGNIIAQLAAVQGVEHAVQYAQGEGFVHDRSGELCMLVYQVRCGTQYIRIEWDPDFSGGDYDDVGNFALLPVGCDVESAFEAETGHPATCIVHYSEDDVYDADGNLLEV